MWLSETPPGTGWQSGGYYEKRTLAAKVNPQARDGGLASRLWDVSCDLLGLPVTDVSPTPG